MAQYLRNPPLDAATLKPEPVEQLADWIVEAREAGMQEPGAMTLATVGADGRPSARVVLCKGFDGGGVCFYTNTESRKGEELRVHADAALVFWWDKLERQVRLEGSVAKLPREAADAYFHSRPRTSQLGAYTSRQSRVVESRERLDARLRMNEAALDQQPVPLPDFWGGYVLKPRSVEFWQGRGGRLHDRLRYRRETPDSSWIVERLEP